MSLLTVGTTATPAKQCRELAARSKQHPSRGVLPNIPTINLELVLHWSQALEDALLIMCRGRSCRSCTQIQRLFPDKVQTPDPHGAGTSLFGPNSRHIQASPLSSLSVPGLRRGLLCPIVRCVRPFSGQGDPHEAGQSTRGASWVMPSFMATSPNGRGCYRIHQCRRGAKQGYDGYEVCQPCNMHVET